MKLALHHPVLYDVATASAFIRQVTDEQTANTTYPWMSDDVPSIFSLPSILSLLWCSWCAIIFCVLWCICLELWCLSLEPFYVNSLTELVWRPYAYLSVRPSVHKKFLSLSDSSEIIRCVGRRRLVPRNGMPCDPIQGQGHESFRVRNSSIFKLFLLRHELGTGRSFLLRVTAGTAIARLSHRNSVRLSVCPSVCPSHGWMRQKRCKLGSSNLHHRLPQRL